MGGKQEDKLNIKAKIELAKILEVVNSRFITNIMFGRLFKIMTYYKRSTAESINMVNIGFDLGKISTNIRCIAKKATSGQVGEKLTFSG